MVRNCIECGKELSEIRGDINGYWFDKTIIFPNMPKLICKDHPDEYYLDESIAILAQELTRIVYDKKWDVNIIDVSDSFMDIIDMHPGIYDVIYKEKIKPIIVDGKLFILSKDIQSFNFDEGFEIAARNLKGSLTGDTIKIIGDMKNEAN